MRIKRGEKVGKDGTSGGGWSGLLLGAIGMSSSESTGDAVLFHHLGNSSLGLG